MSEVKVHGAKSGEHGVDGGEHKMTHHTAKAHHSHTLEAGSIHIKHPMFKPEHGDKAPAIGMEPEGPEM